MSDASLRRWLCAGVFVVWAANNLAPIVNHGYAPGIATNAPLMLILGAALYPKGPPK